MCRTVVVMRRTVVTLSAALLIGCSGGSTSGDGAAPGDAAFNDADVEFVQGMIPHHEDAIRMADMVKRDAVSVGTADLADQIRSAQELEIVVMRELLGEWGLEEDPHAMHKMDDHSMSGMMTNDDYAALDAATGIDFERMWLTMMVEHHEGAVTMSEKVIAEGKDFRVRELAESIIAVQRDEIARMKALLNGL